jgi:crotonobetainyl-CoA:carnitine CoA-transferase CaiB-like acyl-CoA transferase
MLYPVLTPKDILKFSQLESRGYWEEVHHPELGCSITYPGFFLKHRRRWLETSPCTLIGEHNEEIYTKELGLSKKNC